MSTNFTFNCFILSVKFVLRTSQRNITFTQVIVERRYYKFDTNEISIKKEEFNLHISY